MSDRRDAMRSIGAAFADLFTRPVSGPLSKEAPKARPWQRPPGAGPEAEFLQDCTSCGDCASACPHAAIGVLPAGAGKAAGTPAMDTQKNPCHLCEDMPCIEACEPGALLPLELSDVLLGLAEINQASCFAFQGPECGACVGACSVQAISQVNWKPVIDPQVCNGCGLCVPACPVWDGAIRILKV
ncbi:MAG: 4Fe-4S dicluster domain-containing protein [Proteobacteria bacterium]|nr:4Fe-4S dicluster domain-containing protein [Pseudomonadota bacterium]